MAKNSLIVGAVLIVCVAFATAEEEQTKIRENELTFKWYDGIAPEKVEIMEADRNPNPTKHLAEQSDLYRMINGTYKLGATNFSAEFPDSISWTRTAGFVDTVFYAYRQHHNLIIRPDDIWTAILTQLSLYVNANAASLRHSFVDFEGKKELKVEFRSRIDRVDVREFIDKILGLINTNTKPTVYDWITPNFTTTTENDKLTAGVAMMATLQEYFDYEFWGIVCGIPKATILGTVEDWRDIRERVKKLTEFELPGKTVMAEWSSLLERILNEFVSVKEGNPPNEEFWKQAVRVDYKLIDLVCAKINETHLNGWITTFSAFTLNGRWRGGDIINSNKSRIWLKVRTDKLTPDIVEVPIKIYDEYAAEGERNYNGSIITGSMGYSVKGDEVTMQPFSGWIMTITNNPPRYLRIGNKRH